MTIIVIPNLNCNLRCKYCFGHGYGWASLGLNLDGILESMKYLHDKTRGDHFCMHGGECTLVDIDVFEAILKKMYELQGKSAIQTNGTCITDRHIELFKKYNTNVGISFDGFGSLSGLRGYPNDPDRQVEYLRTVEDNMKRLLSNKISVGLIMVLHRVNASRDRCDDLYRSIVRLYKMGIKGGRLNPMWTDFEGLEEYQLTADELAYTWIRLYNKLKSYPDHQWLPFREFTDNLLGYHHSSCSYGRCDYYCTVGAKSILPDGTLGNCDRTHKDGIAYVRPDTEPSWERYQVLKETDCKGCRYWNVCSGGCPSEGIDGDWRNKTRFCTAIYKLYSRIESDIKSLLPNVELVTDLKTEDYYSDIRSGRFLEPFKKLSKIYAYEPSSWKYVRLKENVNNGCRPKSVQ